MFGIIELLPFLFVGLILKLLVQTDQESHPSEADADGNLKKALAEYLTASLTHTKGS
jgi:hypothetical protein